MSKALTTYRTILDAVEPADGQASVSFPPDWAQGRGMFGGLVAGVALRALRSAVGFAGPARSVMTSFISPIAPGDAHLEVEVLRPGRASTTAQARLRQGDELRAVVLASFGLGRTSSATAAPAARPNAPRPDDLPEFPFVPEQTPTFTQHFAHRWTIGQAPFSWARQAELGGWCRFREDQGLADEEIVLALVDAWPAPVLPLLREPAPASSVTWSVGLFEVDATARADDWWFFHGQTAGAADGHAHSTGMLWTPGGAAAAVSQQLVAVFD